MALPELCVLDVGHGNCTVVHAPEGIVIVDAPLGRTLVDFLLSRAISDIDTIIVSHADSDHVQGVTPLLLDDRFIVRRVLVNPDATKDTKAWENFRAAVSIAEERHNVRVSRDLGSNHPTITLGRIRIEVLGPASGLALGGVGGNELGAHGGRRMSSNSLSAVIRVVHDEASRALLASDLDDIGLADLERRSVPLDAELLVFPHHGGHVANIDNEHFTKRLCTAVGAKTVVFSIGRGKHGTPRPEIVKAVEATLPAVHVACTQLSKRCAAVNPREVRDHLSAAPANGAESNVSCIGTVIQDLATGTIQPDRADHATFVQAHAPTHLCLGGVLANSPSDSEESTSFTPPGGS